jgi:hypothetical protein
MLRPTPRAARESRRRSVTIVLASRRANSRISESSAAAITIARVLGVEPRVSQLRGCTTGEALVEQSFHRSSGGRAPCRPSPWRRTPGPAGCVPPQARGTRGRVPADGVRREQLENSADGKTRPADAGLPVHSGRIEGDTVKRLT